MKKHQDEDHLIETLLRRCVDRTVLLGLWWTTELNTTTIDVSDDALITLFYGASTWNVTYLQGNVDLLFGHVRTCQVHASFDTN